MLKWVALVAIALSHASCREFSFVMQDDDRQIIAAVLIAQQDTQRAYEEYAREYPNESGFLVRFLDHRLCVAREIAGNPGEFLRLQQKEPDAAPFPSQFGEVWETSENRIKIPENLIPPQLRWDSNFRYCPSGVIRLGTPDIDGSSARVFVENHCSGWCGWGGEYLLELTRGKWQIVDRNIWWVA